MKAEEKIETVVTKSFVITLTEAEIKALRGLHSALVKLGVDGCPSYGTNPGSCSKDQIAAFHACSQEFWETLNSVLY